jgi:Domain of Unknown Function (DUF748)
LLTYTLAGVVIAPWILRSVIVDSLHEQLALNARLDDVDLNPFALSARFEGFALDEPSGAALLKFDQLDVNFELSSLARWAWTFAEIRLTNPFVRVERDASAQLNLMALAGPNDAAAPVDEPAGPVPRVLVQHFVLQGGRADVVDRAARTPLETSIGPINIAIDGLTTLPDRVGAQEVNFDTERGGHVKWTGNVAFEPFRSEGHATLSSAPLAKLSAYLPAELALVIADGAATMNFDYSVSRPPEGLTAAVRNFAFELRDLKVDRTGAGEQNPTNLMSLDALRVGGGELAWPQRTIAVAEVALEAPSIALSRAADGRFVWEQLMASTVPSEAGAPLESVAAAPAAPEAPSSAAEALPWSVNLARLSIADGVMKFTDQSNTPAADFGVSALNASLESVSLNDDAAFPLHVDFTVDGGGKVAANGTLTLLPALRVDVAAEVTGVALPLAQPYVAAATNVVIEAGTLDLKGQLVSTPDESLAFDGVIGVQDLNVLGEATDARLIGWKQLTLDGLAVRLDAAHAEIASVALDEPYGRVHIAKDGTLNLARVLRPDEPAQGQASGDPVPAAEAPTAETTPAAETTAEQKPWSMKVGRFRMRNGATDYRDENLPIPFAVAIHTLNGEMGAFDATSRSTTKLKLEGQVGEFGIARITGNLQPLDVTKNSTVDAYFENISMPDASPYAIRFAGHKIGSGKLDLKMSYRLEDGRLNGQHDIVLRDFALGEKVDYPDALNLPYGLLISLLKGPDGNIDVELPVEGDLNDPTFRIGGVIAKALVNLLTKIVTSPFRLLGSLVGLGASEQFDQVGFPPGRADLAPPEREKIAKLAQALVQRPQLILHVPGVLDPVADAAALREAQVTERVEAAVAGGDQAARRKVLEQMIVATIPGEPLAGLEEQFTVAAVEGQPATLDELAYLNELQGRLIAAEPLAPDALASLAAQRGAAVRDSVLGDPAVTAERVSVAETQEVELNDNGVVAMTLEVDVAATP